MALRQKKEGCQHHQDKDGSRAVEPRVQEKQQQHDGQNQVTEKHRRDIIHFRSLSRDAGNYAACPVHNSVGCWRRLATETYAVFITIGVDLQSLVMLSRRDCLVRDFLNYL